MIDRTKSNLKIKERKQKNNKIKNIKKTRSDLTKQLIKNANIIFGLDNGSTGTIACINKLDDKLFFQKTPAKLEYDYTKDIKYINRIDIIKLKNWFNLCLDNQNNENQSIIVVLERPMKNPMRFEQTCSAIRAFEATLIVLEDLQFKYIVIDSKEWQHYFFGKNTALINLKLESMKKGLEILLNKYKNKCDYNNIEQIIKNHGDADSLLISQYILEQQ